VVGYLAAGVAIGSVHTGLCRQPRNYAALGDVGDLPNVCIGRHFSVKELARVGRVALWATVVQVVLTIVGGL